MSTETANDASTDEIDYREADDHVDHWTDLQFVYLAIGLAVVTAIEVALSYMIDDLGALFLPLLLILMFIKFFSVVFYFMHLKSERKDFVFYVLSSIVIFSLVLFALIAKDGSVM